MTTVGIMYSGPQQQDIEKLTSQLKENKSLKIDGPHHPRSEDPHSEISLLEIAQRLISSVDILIACGGSRAAEAALRARGNAKEPIIIFTSVADFIINEIDDFSITTEIDAHTSDYDGKRLEILLAFLQMDTPTIGVLRNSNRGDHNLQWYRIFEAAFGKCELVDADVNSSLTIPGAFDLFQAQNVDALLVAADHFFYGNREEIVERANDANYPAIYQWRDFVEIGGLMSYGPNRDKLYDKVGDIVSSILKGTVPLIYEVKDTEFELVVSESKATHFRMLQLVKLLPLPRSLTNHRAVLLP